MYFTKPWCVLTCMNATAIATWSRRISAHAVPRTELTQCAAQMAAIDAPNWQDYRRTITPYTLYTYKYSTCTV